MNTLLIHNRTRLAIDAFINTPAHALMLVGMTGSGKRSLAFMTASKLLNISPAALISYPYFMHIKRDSGESDIPIAKIRELTHKWRLKAIGSHESRRVVVIEDAGRMSVEAQNALLKLLEEPPPGSILILTAASENSVLPTILSRTQSVNVVPVTLEQTREFYRDQKTATEVERAWRLSGGCAGLLSALLNESENHPLKSAVDEAKSFIRQDPYERLITLEEYSSDKNKLFLLLEALNRVLTSLHHSNVYGEKPQAAKLLDSRRRISEIQKALDANANTRLLLIHLAINLSV